MTDQAPTLHLLCGKIAAGKSTLASRLAAAPATLRITEDEWLGALFADQLQSGADYVRCAAKLRTVIGPHVIALLQSGLSVVLDFPANTVEQRLWMRSLAEQSGSAHVLHVLTPPDAVCLARLKARNAEGQHAFAPTEAQFHAFSKNFAPPRPEEGLSCLWYED